VVGERWVTGDDPHGPLGLDRRDLITAFVLPMLAVAVQWTIHDRTIVPMDEGHLAAAASWMLDGKLLYREIHTGIFPGIYLITTLLFGVFGEDMIVMRWAAVVMNCVIVSSLWLIARRMVRPTWALLPPLLHLALVVFSFPVLSMFNYSTLAVCFGLLALLFLLRYLDAARVHDAVWLGLFVACAALTKQNFGGLVFIALLVGLLWGRSGSALATQPLFGVLLPIAAAGSVLTALVMIYFILTGTFLDLLDATILSLGGSQLKDFSNPIPPIFGAHPENDGRFLFLYSPPTVFNLLIHDETLLGMKITPLVRSLAIRLSYGVPLLAVLASPIVLWRTQRWRDAGRERAARTSVVFAVVFFPGIFPSAIWSHLAFVTIPVLLLFAFIADRVDDGLRRGSGGGVPVAIWRGAFALIVLTSLVVAVVTSANVARWNPHPLELERASLRVSERDLGLFRGAHEFVAECAAPGDPIFVAPDIPAVYFLTDRANPTPYDLTIPGNVDGGLIIRRLEETQTRCIVFNPRMYPEFPPFGSLFPQLARYIETQYTGKKVIEAGDSRWIGFERRTR
jgi:hypothetical protein